MTKRSKSTKKLTGYMAAYDQATRSYTVVDRKRNVIVSGLTQQAASDYVWRNRFVFVSE